MSFFWKTMQVNRMTVTDLFGLIRACFTAQGGRDASFRYETKGTRHRGGRSAFPPASLAPIVQQQIGTSGK
jgi:hypothetical protein